MSVEPVIDTMSLFINRVHNERAYTKGDMQRVVGKIKKMLEMKIKNNNTEALVCGRKPQNIIVEVHLDNRELDRVEENPYLRNMIITADGGKDTRERGRRKCEGANWAHT